MRFLKKVRLQFIFPIFLIGILFISCSNEEEIPVDATGSILGRWALDKRHYKSNGIISPEMDYENNNPGCALNDYFEFKNNSIVEIGYYSPSCAVNPGTGSWAKNGNLITLSFPSSEDTIFELLSLSPTQMKVRANLTGTAGVTPGLELFIYYTMVKVN